MSPTTGRVLYAVAVDQPVDFVLDDPTRHRAHGVLDREQQGPVHLSRYGQQPLDRV